MIKKKINSIILGGSRGIGREIYIELNKISRNIIQCSSKDIDTSNLESVKKFIKKNKVADVLILNTGGPPAKDFYKISEKEWSKYFNQLFLSFTIILQKIRINKGGYIFLISSSIIKEPSVGLEISSSLRTGFVSLFKSISLHENNRNISFVPESIKLHKTSINMDNENNKPIGFNVESNLGVSDHIPLVAKVTFIN